MQKQLIRLALVFLLISVACSMPIMAEQATPAVMPKAISQIFSQAQPGSSATPTPFQPVGPTITPSPTITPTPTVGPDPEDEQISGMPTPIRVWPDMPEGIINFMVLGNDLRPGGGYRTDVMILVSMNPKAGRVSVVSFPRDLYVWIPGWTTQRMNTAFAHGGFSMLADTMEYNFGVRPSFYIMTNFDGFKNIVNGMGGIEVNAASYLSDSCDLPQGRAGRCTVYPGSVTMDGAYALWYVRSRHSSNDFDRTRRAQEVLYGIFNKMMSRNAITRLPEMFTAYKDSVETNITISNITPIVPLATQLVADPDKIHRYAIGPTHVMNYITEGGAMVLLPNYDAIKQLIYEAVYSE